MVMRLNITDSEEYKGPFRLTKDDIESELWKKLKSHLEKGLDSHRKTNDHDGTEIRTAMLRGRISAYKEFLDLGEIQDE